VILTGNEWGLEWQYSGIPFEQQKPPKIVLEVVDFLDMWSLIEGAYSMKKETDLFSLVEIKMIWIEMFNHLPL
jgi:hypothetical protein